MKTKAFWIIALAILTLSACNNDTDKKGDSKEQEEIIPNHELIVSENMTIIENSESKMEWDMISRSKIRIEGITLDKVLKLLANDNPARVIIEGKDNFPVMNIEYEPVDIWESSEEGNKQAVIDSLKKFYDFDIRTEKRKMPVVEVLEFDSSLLIPRDDKNLGTSSSISGKIANYKNYTLKKLFETLEREFDLIIEMGFKDNGKYDFELNIVNMDKVKEKLSEEYGFKFNETEKTVEVVVINFK